ncbi:MAG: ABC transporter ATP-binding protein [Candidatus Hodarchaeales archaeon]|jgi:ATP-binding cassette subfamily B protein
MYSERHPFKQLLHYTEGYKRQLYLATLFSILNKIFDLAPPFLIGAAVDIVVERENSIFAKMGFIDPVDQLYFLGFLTILVWGLESFFQYLYSIYWRKLSQTIEHKLRMDSYSHLQHLELEFFEDRQTGGLMSILNDDVNQLERFLDAGLNQIIQLVVTVLVISTAFLIFSPSASIMAIIPMPFIVAFSILFQKKLEPRYKEIRERVGILNAQLSNNLTGVATIKSFTNEEYEKERIGQSSQEYREANNRTILLSSAFVPLIRMFIVVGFTVMLILGGFQALNGFLAISLYSVMIFLIQRLLWPLTSLGEVLDQYQRAMASTRRITGLLETKVKIVSGHEKIETKEYRGEISFQGIDFSYKGRVPVFNNFNVTIQPGETVAFVGSTGAGKSTLVKLLLRFYDPNNGNIKLDNVNIKDFNLQDYRSLVGLVNQDTFLIDGTVKENIAYGLPNESMETIIESAKIAEIHEFVESLPNKYDTLVGERGQKLSGGQRQRIAIARAVLKNPPIMVLDEATSSVDNETEAAIQRSLEKLIIGRTTIIIAHRLSTIRNADRIFLLENGQITEQGKHNELVELNGQYSLLWKVQTGEKMVYT